MDVLNIELWNKNIAAYGDITAYCSNIQYSQTRNGAETLSFELDMAEFHEWAYSIREEPQNLLKPLSTYIKVKENGEYKFGTFLMSISGDFEESGTRISIQAEGYLNILVDRYVDLSVTNTESGLIAWRLIDEANKQQGGETGITTGLTQSSGINRDRVYEKQNVKEGLINLTQLSDGNFDFSFTHDLKFNRIAKIGNERPDIILEYPKRDGSIAVQSMKLGKDGAAMFNKVTAKGSGFGDQAIQYAEQDSGSIVNYFMKEKIISENDVKSLTTLQEKVRGELKLRRDILSLPQLTIKGRVLDDNGVGVGDRVVVKQSLYPLFEMIGYFRIERVEVSFDASLSKTTKITVDNYGL